MDNSFYIFFTAILAVSIVVWRFFPKFKFFIWISKGSLTQIGVLILIIILIGISFHLLDSYGHEYGVGIIHLPRRLSIFLTLYHQRHYICSKIIYICILWPRSQGISFYPDYS